LPESVTTVGWLPPGACTFGDLIPPDDLLQVSEWQVLSRYAMTTNDMIIMLLLQ
jgi:hypothetical protein